MKKRIIAVLVGAFLALNTFGGQMVTAAGESAEDENEKLELVLEEEPEVDKVTEEVTESEIKDEETTTTLLTLDNLLPADINIAESKAETQGGGNANLENTSIVKSVSVNGADSIKKSDKITITYEFVDDLHLNWAPGEGESWHNIETGKEYILSENLGLAGWNFPSQMDLVFPNDVEDSQLAGKKLGDILIKNDNGNYSVVLAVTFESDKTDKTPVEDLKLALQFEINVADNFEDEKISLSVPGQPTKTFEVADNITTPPTIEIKGSQTDAQKKSGQVTWESTITNNSLNAKKYDDGYTFTGTISENQDFVPGTVYIKIGDGEWQNVDDSFNGKIFTYTFTGDALASVGNGGTVSVKYDTVSDYMSAISTIGNKNETSVSVSNKAAISDANVTAADGNLNAAKIFDNSWIKKEIISDAKDGNDTTWQVTINTNGETVSDLVLSDTFSGDAKLELSGEPTVKVNDETANYSIDKEKSPWTISFSKPVKGEVIIQYKTVIDDYVNYLRSNKSNKPTNTASIAFTVNSKRIQGPSDKYQAEMVTNAGLDITKAEYNPANHEIKWHVVVNKKHQAVTQAKLDNPIDSNQEFVRLENASGITVSEDGTEITIGDATSGAEFDIVTKIKDEKIADWSLNATNSADYKKSLTLHFKEGAEVATSKTATITSEVLKVSDPTYDYDKHEASFEAVIDNNKMEMGGILVDVDITQFDSIKDVKVDGNACYYTESDDNKTITIQVPNINQGSNSTITFTGHVKDDNYTSVNNGKVSIPVQFTLHTADLNKIDKTQTESTTLSFNNQILNKSYDVVDGTDAVVSNYTVVINAAKNTLPEVVKLVDTMGSSLSLETDSVKLYKASINSITGQVSTDNANLTPVNNYKFTSSINSNEQTVLKVNINTEDPDNNIYVLKYSAVVMDKKSVGNSISMSAGSKNFGATATIDAKLLASISGKAAVVLNVTLADKEKDNSLEDKTIRVNVYKDSLDTPVASLNVPINGKSRTIGKLKKDEDYVIKVDESSIPEGYAVPAAQHVKATNGNMNLTVPFELVKKTKDLSFGIEDSEDKTPIIGATLVVKDESGNTTNTFKYGHTYTITETKAPYGYEGKKTATFTIGNNGTVTVDDGELIEDKIVLYDKKLGGNPVVISTVSSELGNPIKGAKYRIVHDETGEVVYDDVMMDESITLSLPSGNYTITEVDAPKGFKSSNETKLTVENDGKILVDNKEVEDTVAITNPYNDAENVPAEELFGTDPTKTFDGKKYAVFTYTGEDFDPTVAKPVTIFYDDPEQELDGTFTGFHEQTPYILVDMDKLPSFSLQDSKIFKSSVLPKLDEEGNATNQFDKKLEVISTKTGDSKVIDLSSEDPTTTDELINTVVDSVIPRAPHVPVVSTGAGEPEHHHYYGPAKPVANDELKDKEITALANTAAAANGARLAKTGGFLGTLTGYLAAALLMIVGAYLVFGNRKRVK